MPQLRRPRPAWLLAPLVGLASLFASRGEIRSPFVIDDWMYLSLSQGSQWHGYVDDPSSSVYRPGLMAWFVAGYHLVGLHASAFRVAGFAVLLVNAGLIAWICRRFGLSPAAAAIGASVYALHPALTGGVTWVSAVNALLVAFFALLAALLLCVPAPSWRHGIAAAVAALLALLMREDAVVLVLAVPGLRLAWLARVGLPATWRDRARAAVPVLPLAAVVVAYAGVRLAVGASTKGTAYETGTARLWPNAQRVLEYLAVWPMRVPAGALSGRRFELEGIVFALVVLGLSVLVVRRRPLALAGCWWAVLGSAPALLLVRHAVEPYYLDLVVPGLALAVAALAQAAGDLWGARGLPVPRPAPAAAVVVLVVVGALLARNVNMLQHKRSANTRYAARGQVLLARLPAVLPADAVLCLPPDPRWNDFAIAENGEMFRVVRHDHALGLVVLAAGKPAKVSYGAGFRTLAGRPVVVLADPSRPDAVTAGACTGG